MLPSVLIHATQLLASLLPSGNPDECPQSSSFLLQLLSSQVSKIKRGCIDIDAIFFLAG